MKKKKKIYISSAFTIGWQLQNMRRQMNVAKELKLMGYDPFIPLLLPFFEFACPDVFDEREMLDWELSFLDVCDALVRIRFKDPNGIEIPSSGADIEVERANSKDITVYEFESIKEMKKYLIKYTI